MIVLGSSCVASAGIKYTQAMARDASKLTAGYVFRYYMLKYGHYFQHVGSVANNATDVIFLLKNKWCSLLIKAKINYIGYFFVLLTFARFRNVESNECLD